MTEAQRHQILLEMLAQLGFVTVEKVVERLGISPATARRDINKLDESGKLKKVRNGAGVVSGDVRYARRRTVVRADPE